jgi:hypothetical protein
LPTWQMESFSADTMTKYYLPKRLVESCALSWACVQNGMPGLRIATEQPDPATHPQPGLGIRRVIDDDITSGLRSVLRACKPDARPWQPHSQTRT